MPSGNGDGAFGLPKGSEAAHPSVSRRALTVPSRSARRGLLGFVIAFLVIAELFYHIFRRCQPLFRQEGAQKEEHGRQQAGHEHGREPGRGLEKGVYPGVPQGA